MEELLELEQGLRLNPYVTQTDKLSKSLHYLSQAFVGRQVKSYEYESEQIYILGKQLQAELCGSCSSASHCELGQAQGPAQGQARGQDRGQAQGQDQGQAHEDEFLDMIQLLVEDIHEYGMELSVGNKRALGKRCDRFGELKERVNKNLWEWKMHRMWEEKLEETKEASFAVMQALVHTLQETTKEIDASIFRDEYVERKIVKYLKNMGVRTLKVLIFVSEEGHYEVHISAKPKSDACVTTKEMGMAISRALGRKLEPEMQEGFVLREGYNTIAFVEPGKYQIIWGTSKVVKEGSSCSGDNFLVLDQGGGKKCALLSDGMGSGAGAFAQSKLVLEMAEALLEAGVPPKQAVEMVNALLLSHAGEVKFATLDMGIVDTYTGTVELFKAGAATTFVVSGGMTKCYEASSLPMGVMANVQANHFRFHLPKDGYIIMLTDGVLEGVVQEEREVFIRSMVKKMKSKNPTEIGEKILEKAIEKQGGVAKDDMMILVLAAWEM